MTGTVQAYEIKAEGERLQDENMQLRRQAEDNSRQIETLKAQAAAAISEQKSTSVAFGFAQLFDRMNAKAASTGAATQLNPEADNWALPEERAVILRQLRDTQPAETGQI